MPPSQAEAPGQVERPFPHEDGVHFSLLSLSCPGDSSLPCIVSLIVSVLWGPRNIGLPHHQSQVLKGHPLCGLHMATGFNKAMGSLGLGQAHWFHCIHG